MDPAVVVGHGRVQRATDRPERLQGVPGLAETGRFRPRPLVTGPGPDEDADAGDVAAVATGIALVRAYRE